MINKAPEDVANKGIKFLPKLAMICKYLKIPA
jgi:hypothetical protein